ncbi:MAG: ABC transporter substrate-binding protein [Chloroflexota bacterium]|nr:ABC transporter substrate-binding protein [Chloroflexota bacterium]
MLTACAPTPYSGPTAQTALSTPTPSAPTPVAFPFTIVDDLGRSVIIAKLPQRIVSLSPSNTEILFAIGAGDQVVGVTQFCNYPAEAKTKPQIGGFSAATISVEKIVELKPDLVLSAGAIQKPVIEALERAQIPVFAVDPATIEGVYGRIESLGRLTGHLAEANRVTARMNERVAAVKARVKNVPQAERPKVFYEVWNEPLMTAGPGTLIGQMIDVAGGVNILAEITQQYVQVSAEEVIKRNPDVIMGPDVHGSELHLEKIQARAGWGVVKAVQQGRIALVVDDLVSRHTPRLVDGLEAVARGLYPNLFP